MDTTRLSTFAHTALAALILRGMAEDADAQWMYESSLHVPMIIWRTKDAQTPC